MVMDHLTGRLGSEPILSMSVNVTVAVDGDGDGDGMYKRTLRLSLKRLLKWEVAVEDLPRNILTTQLFVSSHTEVSA